MSRLLFDGAEIGNLNWLSSASAGVTAATDQKRSGLYSYRLVKSTSYNDAASKSFPSGLSEFYFRTAWRITNSNNTNHSIQFRNGTTVLISLGLDITNSLFTAYVGGTTLVATGSIPYQTNTWYLLEFHVKIADTGGVIQLKIDGILDIDYSGDTQPSTQTAVDNVYLRVNTNQNTHYTWFDDMALNDINGSTHNSWCGDGQIILEQKPNAAGDVTQMAPSAGSNYACVDDIPPNGDTDYVDGDVNEYDLYGLVDSTIPSESVIRMVCVVANARDTVAAGGAVALGLKTGGTEYWSSDIPLLTTYLTIRGTVYETNPSTGLPWTISELSSLQAGAKAKGP